MLKLTTEGGAPIYLAPAHIVLVAPENHPRLATRIETETNSYWVTENAEDVAGMVREALEGLVVTGYSADALDKLP